ncbi:MAG TPA: hypothetical protein VGR00_06555, partial [Thermoanaerobaculia bacterium]|nr:hypothetical protein [Thermoanaerobaculia bacterium]
MRNERRSFLPAPLVLFALARAASAAPEGVVVFPAQLLVDGSKVASHASGSGDPSDARAAERRLSIVRSPYRVALERRELARDMFLELEPGFTPEFKDQLFHGLSAAAAALFERDGWPRPASSRSPLRVIVTNRGRSVPSASGFAERRDGAFVDPVVGVEAGGRDSAAVLLDVVHQVALLSARQIGADEAAWSVEGLADYLARRVLGLSAAAVPANDPFLADEGTLRDPVVLASFLEAASRRAPKDGADVRAAWEEAGASRGDDAEAFVRAVASRADSEGLPALLSDLVGRHVARAAERLREREGAVLDDRSATSPGSLSWRRLSFSAGDENGGLEIALPEDANLAAGRAVLLYRGGEGAGGFDTLPLEPGKARVVPLSAAESVDLVLVDGAGGALTVRLRRVHGYPATLVAFAAEWKGEVVEVSWRTASHQNLLAFVLERVEETDSGGLASGTRQIVPTVESSEGGYAYVVADRDVVSGRRYRYRVLALTTDGLVGEMFHA